MTKSRVLELIRVAGYHSDLNAYRLLFIENNITRLEADTAYRKGKMDKLDGVKCDCKKCKSDRTRKISKLYSQ